MTTTQRTHLAAQFDAARHRSERAASLGDRAGSLIAAGDARRILARLINAQAADLSARAR